MGYDVAHDVPRGPAWLRDLRSDPPAAVVVDLSRYPSHGRDVALAIRQHKATRGIPLVFVGGEPEKVAQIRNLLPDAVFADWGQIAGPLREAVAHPPVEPVVPPSVLAGYAGTPLPRKLGVKPGTVVALIGAPDGFLEMLADLAEGAAFHDRPGTFCHLTIWFARSRAELQGEIPRIGAQAVHGPIWIAWPKKAAATNSDLSEQYVREIGLGAGLVDYKICAIDQTWSGLLFARRKGR
jgi:hypothetical protein